MLIVDETEGKMYLTIISQELSKPGPFRILFYLVLNNLILFYSKLYPIRVNNPKVNPIVHCT